MGDLHGQLPLLDELLRTIAFDPGTDRLVAAGDVIDRGSRVGDLLLFLREGARSGWFFPVMGNHEEAFLKVWSGGTVSYYTERSFGGGVTLGAFEGFAPRLRKDLVEWISSWPLTWESPEAIVVHGSLPSLPGSNFGDVSLCRTRMFGSGESHECLELRPPDLFPSWDGRLVVSGHTIVRKAAFWSDSIAMVDTGAYRTGILSTFCLETRIFSQVAGVPS